MDFNRDLEIRIRASIPALYIIAREDWRCQMEVKKVAEKIKYKANFWNAVDGWGGGKNTDPLAALKAVSTQALTKLNQSRDQQKDQLIPKTVWVLLNFHRYLDDPQMIQTIKGMIQVGKATGQILIFVSNLLKIPPELLDDLTLMEFNLPDSDLLAERADYMMDSVDGGSKLPEDIRDKVAEAALGMTTWEAENAMGISLLETGMIMPEVVSREKAAAVRKSEVLEVIDDLVDMKDVGGADNFKAWMEIRRKAFSKEARKFGIKQPKGVLFVGVPGCGKSWMARAIPMYLGIPLLRLDMGKVFAGIVGQSEERVRRVQATADAVAPACLWIDEIEKGMSGMGGSGTTDSGVTSRVMGSFLTWMQEGKRPVFKIATANNVLSLPPELMRAGRWDEIFFVDLPSEVERIESLTIHLRRRKRDPSKFNIQYVAKETSQFSHAELEKVVDNALYLAFASNREVITDDLLQASRSLVPLAVTRREDIEAMRKWAEQRAVPVSSTEPPKMTDDIVERKRVLKLTTFVEEEGGDS